MDNKQEVKFDHVNWSLGETTYDLESGFPPQNMPCVVCTEVRTISWKDSKIVIAHTTDNIFVRQCERNLKVLEA